MRHRHTPGFMHTELGMQPARQIAEISIQWSPFYTFVSENQEIVYHIILMMNVSHLNVFTDLMT